MTKLFEKIKDVVRHQSGGLTYQKEINHDYDSEVLFDYKGGVRNYIFSFWFTTCKNILCRYKLCGTRYE